MAQPQELLRVTLIHPDETAGEMLGSELPPTAQLIGRLTTMEAVGEDLHGELGILRHSGMVFVNGDFGSQGDGKGGARVLQMLAEQDIYTRYRIETEGLEPEAIHGVAWGWDTFPTGGFLELLNGPNAAPRVSAPPQDMLGDYTHNNLDPYAPWTPQTLVGAVDYTLGKVTPRPPRTGQA